jgi:hypothetical protein
VHVGTPFAVEVTVRNLTAVPHVLAVAVAESDLFLLAGMRQALFDAPPRSSLTVRFTLLAVAAGQVRRG